MLFDSQAIVDYLVKAAPMAAILAAFVTVIAYIHSPRLKVLVFSTPIPFTCAFVMLWFEGRQGINTTHLAGLAISAVYHWMVFVLHVRWRCPLLLAIALSAGGYVLTTSQLRFLAGVPLAWSAAAFVGIWLICWWLYRPTSEPGQRATAPWPVKLLTTFVLAMGIFTMTDLLAGAVTTFPYAGVFTSYEMRRCLRTLAGQYAINILAFATMMLTIRLFQGMGWPGLWPLLPGWVALIVCMGLIYRLKLGQPSAVVIAAPAGAAVSGDR